MNKIEMSFLISMMVLLFSSQHAFAWAPEMNDWLYRKEVTVSSTDLSDLNGYQVNFLLDSENFNFSRAKLNGNDIRFTWLNATSNSEQTIPFWINYWNSTAQKASIWVKVPLIPSEDTATLYLYYRNKKSTYSESDAKRTFDFFDDFNGGARQLTSVGNHIAVDRVTNKLMDFNSLTYAETAYAYKDLGAGAITDFILDFDYLSTTPAQYDPRLAVGFADTLGTPNTVTNGLYIIISNNNDAASARSSGPWNGPITTAERGSPEIKWANRDVTFYYTFTRVGTTAKLSIFSDPERTSHISGSPVTLDVETTPFRYFYPLTSIPVYNADNYQSGWLDNIRIRKYTSIEPSIQSIGSDQFNPLQQSKPSTTPDEAGATIQQENSQTNLSVQPKTDNLATPSNPDNTLLYVIIAALVIVVLVLLLSKFRKKNAYPAQPIPPTNMSF